MNINERFSNVKSHFFQAIPENVRLERIWFIAKTDFKQRYYGSFLGLFWALFNPLLQMILYYLVFSFVFESGERYFSLFLFCGLIHFIFFVEASTKAMAIFGEKRHLFENIQINKLDVYYSNILANFLGFLFNFMVFYIIRIFIVDELPSAHILLYPLVLFQLILFTHGLSLILSIVWVNFRDVVHIWNIFTLALMWLSGVFFSIDLSPDSNTSVFGVLTPFSGILINARAVLIYNEPINWQLYGFCTIYTLIIWGIGLYLFNNYARKALEKL